MQQKSTGSPNSRERKARSAGHTEWTGIPRAARDSKEVSGLAKELNIIPRYDNAAAFGFAAYLRALGSVSHSFAISTERVIELAFTGVEAKSYSPSGFKREITINTAAQEALYLWADNFGINGEEGVADTSREIERLLRYDGNAFVHVRIVKFQDARRVEFNVLDPNDVAISATAEYGASTSIVYAPDLLNENTKLKKDDVFRLPHSTVNKWVWNEIRLGQGVTVQETVLQVRNKQGGTYYGTSFVQDVIESCRVEYHYGVLGAKIAATETTAKFLIFFEEEEAARSEAGIDNFTPTVAALRNVISNEGTNAQSFAAMEYPTGTKEPKVASVEIARDTAWKDAELKRAMYSICARNGINPIVANLIQSVSGIGSNQTKDVYTVFSIDVLSLQGAHEYLWSDIIYQLGKQTQVFAPDGVTFGFANRAELFARAYDPQPIETVQIVA